MAGGIFSGSSNVVRGSASAAEAAARRAEEAAAAAEAAIDALEVYTGQDETDNKYTVPPGADTNDATLFLNQEGDWIAPDGSTPDPYVGTSGITVNGLDISITDGGVSTTKLANTSVNTSKIEDLAVTGSKIADGAVDTTQLATGSVNRTIIDTTNPGTDGQVLSRAGDRFTWVTDTSIEPLTAGDGIDITSDVISVADDGITTVKILDANITVDKLAANSVTNDKIVNSTIEGIKLADDAVTAAKLATNSVGIDAIDVTDGTVNQVLTTDGVGGLTFTSKTAGGAVALNDLSDVDTSGAVNNDVLEFNGTEWVPAAGSVGTFAGLSDTNINSPSEGNYIHYTGGEWANIPNNLAAADLLGFGILDDLLNVNAESVSNNDILIYNDTSNTWNTAQVSTLSESLSDLTDVSLSTPGLNEFLRFNGTEWVNANVSIPENVTAGTGISVSGSEVSVTNPFTAADETKLSGIETGATADQTDAEIVTAAESNANIALLTAATNPVFTDTDTNTTYTAGSGLDLTGTVFSVTNEFTDADETKLDGISTGADVTLSSISAGANITISNDGVIAATGGGAGDDYLAGTGLTLTGTTFSVTNPFTDADETKLDGIEAGATTDQTDAEIITAVRTNANFESLFQDSNPVFTDTTYSAGTGLSLNGTEFSVTTPFSASQSTKLAGIETGAQVNPSFTSGLTLTGTTVSVTDGGISATKLSNSIPISTLSDVNTTGVSNGQILSYNGTTWVPVNNSGGGNTDNSRLAITLSPTSLDSGDGDTQVDVTLSITNMVSGETISGQSITVTDPTGHTVTPSGSDNDFMFTANGDNVGNYVIRASATFTLTGGTMSVHSSSANLPVNATNTNWYQWVTDTQPNAITDTGVVNNGVYNSPETGTWTRPTEDTDSSELAYVALPTRDNGYTFHAGLLFASITDLGTISTNYTLYRLDDFPPVAPGGNRIITITET